MGIVILAHEHLHRVRQLSKALASPQVKVVIHVDANVDDEAFNTLQKGLTKNQHIMFSDRVACDWGRFSLVEAGLSSAELLLKRWPDVTHITQVSGSCLPVRPINELVDFLNRQPNRDFVESACVKTEDWVVDGLALERFSLYFPFSWRRQRTLFDASVALQRKLGISRRVPSGITPHLGSQWWCLSVRTLRAILNDPLRATYDRYFERCWIPDEGYIPTLVRKHSLDLVNQSLTLSRFDDQGKPHLFYDDHADMLRQTDHFFARKIWHRADLLYREFLRKKPKQSDRPMETEFGLDLIFKEARTRRCEGRPGRVNVGRFPAAKYQRQPATVAPYGAFLGFSHVFDGFENWLSDTTGTMAHGRLYKKNAVQFARNMAEMRGGITANPKIRDHNPEQFLCNLLWSSQAEHHAMMYELSDGLRMAEFLAQDRHAKLFVLGGSWVLDLFARDHSDDQLLKRQAKKLLQFETDFIKEVEQTGRKDVLFLKLKDIVSDTDAVLTQIQANVRPEVDLRPEIALLLRDLNGLQAFSERLRKLGIDTSSLGELPAKLPGADRDLIPARATA